jgi:hypothetical protein
MLHLINNKIVVNRLHNDRYNDITNRGKYLIVYCDKYYINFLSNVKVHHDRKYNYIPPPEFLMINYLINYLINLFNKLKKMFL